MKTSSGKLRTGLVALGSTFAAAVAFAYIPPSAFIVEKVARKHQNARTLKIKSRITALSDGRPTETQFVAVTTFDAASGTIESYATDDGGQRLYSVERKAPGIAATLLMDSSNERVSNQLKAAGVPVVAPSHAKPPGEKPVAEEPSEQADRTTMSRWKNSVAWILGDYRKPLEPQLWVEKDTFLPLRLISNSEGGKIDVQFESYRFHREVPYPHTVLLSTRNGAPNLQAEALDVTVGAQAARTTGKSGFTEAGSSAPSALRELILLYYAVLQ